MLNIVLIFVRCSPNADRPIPSDCGYVITWEWSKEFVFDTHNNSHSLRTLLNKDLVLLAAYPPPLCDKHSFLFLKVFLNDRGTGPTGVRVAIFPYKFRGPAIHYNSTNIHQKVTPMRFLRSLRQDLSNGTKAGGKNLVFRKK
jgi:hypothetical protein